MPYTTVWTNVNGVLVPMRLWVQQPMPSDTPLPARDPSQPIPTVEETNRVLGVEEAERLRALGAAVPIPIDITTRRWKIIFIGGFLFITVGGLVWILLYEEKD
jgi:hypothetical protein